MSIFDKFTADDIAKLKKFMETQYFLFPKNRAYQFLGGAVVTLIAIVGLSWAGAAEALKTTEARIATEHVKMFEIEAAKSVEALGKLKDEWLHQDVPSRIEQIVAKHNYLIDCVKNHQGKIDQQDKDNSLIPPRK